jgi:hypothetical protein
VRCAHKLSLLLQIEYWPPNAKSSGRGQGSSRSPVRPRCRPPMPWAASSAGRARGISVSRDLKRVGVCNWAAQRDLGEGYSSRSHLLFSGGLLWSVRTLFHYRKNITGRIVEPGNARSVAAKDTPFVGRDPFIAQEAHSTPCQRVYGRFNIDLLCVAVDFASAQAYVLYPIRRCRNGIHDVSSAPFLNVM